MSSSDTYTPGVLLGFRTGAELLKSGAQAVFEKPSDLLRLFQD
ncbi:MAG: hypothetical protein ABIJ35_07725 [Acidobacteriota bacterium]